MACGATCGITRVRERERRIALAAARRAYPGLVWREAPEPRALAAHEADAIAALGRTIESILPVRALLRPADSGECDALYLLAGVHAPSLFEIDRDGAPLEAGEPSSAGDRDRAPEAPPRRDRETYVRVAFSPIGRFVTIQEVTMTATKVDGASFAIEEERVVGVADKRLQHVVKGLQGALREARWVVLDMAFLAGDAGGEARQEAYEARYGAPPSLWSLLFEAAPPSTSRIALVSRGRDVEPRASA